MEFRSLHSLMRSYSFYMPVKVVLGINSSKSLLEEVRNFPGRRVLAVSGKNVSKLGIPQQVLAPLERDGYDVFLYDEVPPEPPIENASEVAEVARRGFDVVVGIGGGSAMDMAKVASAAITNPEPVERFIGAHLIKRRSAPLVQVPTLFGTGSEVTPISVMTKEGVKVAIWSYNIFPHVSILDPALSVSAPPKATSSAGVDALCHAVESLMSVESTWITDAMSLQAIRLISHYLEKAYANGEDLEAKLGLAYASTLAGASLANAMACLGHGIAYTFAVRYNVPHGVSCGVAEPYVMDYNSLAAPEKLSSIADSFGVDVSGLGVREAAFEAINAFIDLLKSLGMPTSLKELGVKKDDIRGMVDELFSKQSRFIARNPRKPTKEDMVELYERMWEGVG